MSQTTIQGRDVYVKVTDTQDGTTAIVHHRAWDVERFMSGVQKQYRESDAKDKTPGRHQVVMSDKDEYRTYNWENRRAA